MLQQPVGMAFLFNAFGIAQNAGDQPHRRVQHGLRRNLAAGQHEIPQGHLFDVPMVQHPLIHAFKPTTQQRNPIRRRPCARGRLIKRLAARRQIHHRPTHPVARGAIGGHAQCCIHHIGAQDHPRAAPRWGVIDVAMLAKTKAPQINRLQPPAPHLQRLARQRQAQGPRKGIREQRDNLGHPSAFQQKRLFHQDTRL